MAEPDKERKRALVEMPAPPTRTAAKSAQTTSSYAGGNGVAALASGAAARYEMKTKGVDKLSGQRAPGTENDPRLAQDPDSFKKNSPDPSTRLPFNTEGGWDAQEILKYLGQHDRLQETDSDASRCVQAIGLASHILLGPAYAISYLAASGLDRLLSGGAVTANPRQQAAQRVLEAVIERLRVRAATYGDLSWAQEALHAIWYFDTSGTPSPDVRDRVVPRLDLSSIQAMSVMCASKDELAAEAAKLAENQQLLITKWRVLLNETFEQLEDQGEKTSRVMKVAIVEPSGKRKLVTISRITAPPKPPGSKLDFNRDNKQGHQLLLYKKGGKLYLYEPELTDDGTHLQEISSGAGFAELFSRDDDKLQRYDYVEVLGRITPPAFAP